MTTALAQSSNPIHPELAGTARIPIATLRSKLGLPAFLVWSILLQRRNFRAETHATRKGIANAKGFERLSEETVKDALARLRAMRLVRDVGFVKRVVPRGEKRVKRKVYVRVVYGARLVTSPFDPKVAIVPPQAARAIALANTHGGRRAGAGRRRKTSGLKVIRGGQDPGVLESARRKADHTSESSTPGSGVFKYPHRIGSLGSQDPHHVFSRFAQENTPVERGSSFSIRREAVAMKRIEKPGEIIWTPNEIRLRPTIILGGEVPRWASDVVPPCKIPDPPELDPKTSARRRAHLLAAAYRGAIRTRFGDVPQACVLLSGDITRARPYGTLLGAAEALVEHEIPPAAWALWSVDVKLGHSDDETKPPPITWVFNRKRIEANHGWFWGTKGPIGGRVVTTPSYRELTRRFEAMQRDLLARWDHEPYVAADQPEVVRPIIAKHFPGDSFAELCERARGEAAARRAELKTAARRGEWLWSYA